MLRKSLSSLILCAALSACSAGLQPPTTSASAAAEVERFFMEGIEAFNRHDLDQFTRQFAPDIEMFTPTGWLIGGEAVRTRFEETFAQFPAVRMEIEGLEAREVAPGMVLTRFAWRVYPMGQGPAFHGVGSGVYLRRDGVWVEVLEHETVTRTDEALRAPPAK